MSNELFKTLLQEDDASAVENENETFDDTQDVLGEAFSDIAFNESEEFIDGNEIEMPDGSDDVDKLQIFTQDHIGANVSDDAVRNYDPDRQANGGNDAFVPTNMEEGLERRVLGEDVFNENYLIEGGESNEIDLDTAKPEKSTNSSNTDNDVFNENYLIEGEEDDEDDMVSDEEIAEIENDDDDDEYDEY